MLICARRLIIAAWEFQKAPEATAIKDGLLRGSIFRLFRPLPCEVVMHRILWEIRRGDIETDAGTLLEAASDFPADNINFNCSTHEVLRAAARQNSKARTEARIGNKQYTRRSEALFEAGSPLPRGCAAEIRRHASAPDALGHAGKLPFPSPQAAVNPACRCRAPSQNRTRSEPPERRLSVCTQASAPIRWRSTPVSGSRCKIGPQGGY